MIRMINVTFKLIVVLVVDVAVRVGSAAEEALLVGRLHVDEQLAVAEEARLAEPAHHAVTSQRFSMRISLQQRLPLSPRIP